MRDALKAFWRLGIKQHVDVLKAKEPDSLRALPLFRNWLFELVKPRARRKVEARWATLGFTALGDLFNQITGEPLTRLELQSELHLKNPTIAPRAQSRLATKLHTYSGSIPADIKDFLRQSRPPFRKGDYAQLIDDLGYKVIGVFTDHNRLSETRSDASGWCWPYGTPHDVSEWDKHQELEKVAKWGHTPKRFQPVAGRLADTYPLDHGWTWGNHTHCHHLSELTIKRMTRLFTDLLTKNTKFASAPPNAQSKWNSLLQRHLPFPDIPWDEIWKSLGNFLLSPKDENTWWKYLHRALHVRSRDATLPDHSCRLCGAPKESMLHLLTCPKIKKVQDEMKPLLEALGVAATHPHASWLLCLDSNGKILHAPAQAVIRLFWRHTYRHMVRVETEKAQFLTSFVTRDVVRAFMAKIIALQKSRRDFHLKRLMAQNPNRPLDLVYHLPQSLSDTYAPFGELCKETGSIELHTKLIDVFKSHNVWNDFNGNHGPSSQNSP